MRWRAPQLKLRTEAGDTIPLVEFSILIGRRSGCHVVIEDPRVSAHHCVVFLGYDGHWYVEDLDSTNGTFVNDNRINVKQLEVGNELRIGKDHKFRVESDG